MQENRDHNIVELEKALGSRYEDYRFLSQGGMGMVFIARDTILDKKVVIKLLQSTFDDNQAFIRFQREAQTSSKLSHTNIVATLDFGLTAKNFPYIVMDYIDGESLDDILKREGALSEETAVEIACQIARGMSHAHSRGIIHRDLKTANIIISGYPQKIHATIIDFGLARRESQGESSGRLTRLGCIIGTPLYMSPEQASGKAGDERSDIYSLGCILFKMLTDRTPFDTGESITILQQKTSSEAPALSQSAPDINCTPVLEKAVAKALTRAPESRQQSMQELESDLVRSLQPETAERTKEETVKTQKKRIKTRDIFISIAALLLVVSVAFLTLNNKTEPIAEAPGAEPKEPEKFTYGDDRISYLDETGQSLIAKDSVTDEDLVTISEKYGHLKFDCLILKGTKIKGSGLQYIKDLPIRYLDLTDTDLDQQAYAHLTKIKKLKILELHSSTINGAGLANLETASNIRNLSLNSCKNIKPDDLSPLRNLKLSGLDLVSTNINDQSLIPVSKIETLQELLLDNTKITDRAFEILKPCRRLKDLRLSNCRTITAEGMKTLAQNWPRLQYLELAYTNLTDESLHSLYPLKNLTYLNLMDIPITDSATEWIVKNKRMRTICLSNTRLTDKGIERLSNLKHLRIFRIYLSPEVSPEALEKAFKKWKGNLSAFQINTDIKANLAFDKDGEMLELFKKTDLDIDSISP